MLLLSAAVGILQHMAKQVLLALCFTKNLSFILDAKMHLAEQIVHV